MQTNNTNTFCFAVKLDGLDMTAIFNCSTSDQQKAIMLAITNLSKLIQAPGVSFTIQQGLEEEDISGELH
jgi:hypothetical protein